MPTKAKDRLRPYQRDLARQATAALDEHGSVVLQLPTGGGKTHIAVEIAKRALALTKRVWFVCHRKEILDQTAASFAAAGVPHGIVASGREIEPEHQVQICSVGSLARRLEKLESPDLVLWDECHHVTARTWAAIKTKLKDAHHLGLTATPDRLDGTGLRSAFNHLICGPDTRWLIEQGHLSRYRLFGPTIPDLRGVKTKSGDYDKAGVEEEMTKPVLVGDVVDHYKRLAPGARAIAFAISVKASLAVVERFRAAGIPAQHVDAKTPHAQRDAAVEALRLGTIKVLSNVELFTEGFDLPAIDAVILLRPTKSLAMYRQMIGRGLRQALGKVDTVILDHSGLVYEHGLPDDHIEWTLEGYSRPKENGDDGEGRSRLRRCPECTAIHAWAAECVECGHVYGPEERTIDEVYGELRSFSPEIFVRRSGFETQKEFGIRFGVTEGAVQRWVRKGLPHGVNGVDILNGINWVQQHVPNQNVDANLEKIKDFAIRIGVRHSAVSRMVGRGMPRSRNGLIPINEALDWCKKHADVLMPVDGKEVERKRDFAFRICVNENSVKSWADEGMPCTPNGWIVVQEALEWIKIHNKSCGRKDPTKSEKDFVRKIAFARLHNMPIGFVNKAIAAGMPFTEGGWISNTLALEWLDKNPLYRKCDGPIGSESAQMFSKRVCRSEVTIKKWKKIGLPFDVISGWIIINPALEWFKVNGRKFRSK